MLAQIFCNPHRFWKRILSVNHARRFDGDTSKYNLLAARIGWLNATAKKSSSANRTKLLYRAVRFGNALIATPVNSEAAGRTKI